MCQSNCCYWSNRCNHCGFTRLPAWYSPSSGAFIFYELWTIDIFEVEYFWLTTKLAQLKDNATWCNFSDQVLLFKNILVAPAGVSRSNHISSDQVLPLKNILVLPSGVSRSNHLINRNILVLVLVGPTWEQTEQEEKSDMSKAIGLMDLIFIFYRPIWI